MNDPLSCESQALPVLKAEPGHRLGQPAVAAATPSKAQGSLSVERVGCLRQTVDTSLQGSGLEGFSLHLCGR